MKENQKIVDAFRARREQRIEERRKIRADQAERDKKIKDAFCQRRKERLEARGINLDAVERNDVDFEENDHPRAKNGQFTSKGKEGSGTSEKKTEKKEEKKEEKKSEGNRGWKTINPKAKTGRNSDGSLYKGKLQSYRTAGTEERENECGVTIKDNTDEEGNWTPERQALHKEIIDSFFEGKKKATGERSYTFMGGGPASGKSFVVKRMRDRLGLPSDEDSIKVDCDSIKEDLPEFDPKNPGPVHEESSALAKAVKRMASESGYNVLDDGTGDGSVDSMRKKIKQAKDNGMKVEGVYVTTSIENALVQNAQRARSVGEDMLIDTHKKISEILPQIAKDFDKVTLWQNDKGKEPVLIAEGGGGEDLKIYDQKLYDNFIAKKDYKPKTNVKGDGDMENTKKPKRPPFAKTLEYYYERNLPRPDKYDIMVLVHEGKTLDDYPYEVTPEIEDMYVRYKKQYDTVKANTGKEPILTLLDD